MARAARRRDRMGTLSGGAPRSTPLDGLDGSGRVWYKLGVTGAAGPGVCAPIVQWPRTPDSQSGDRGSTPRGGTSHSKDLRLSKQPRQIPWGLLRGFSAFFRGSLA